MQMLAEMDPALAVPSDRVRPLGGGHWELKVVIDAECQRGLEQLRGLLSHVDPHMTLGQLVGRLAQEGLDRHDPGRPRGGRRTGRGPAGAECTSAPNKRQDSNGAASSAPNRSAIRVNAMTSPANAQADPAHGAPSPAEPSAQPAAPRTVPACAPEDLHAGVTTSAAKSRTSGRAIPAAVKREIWQRDGGRCRFVDPRTGRRCASRHLLQIDHVLPYALGGGAEPVNLRLLCSAHHRYRHAEPASPRGSAE